MAFDIFLKLDGIEGESRDTAHRDEIDVLHYRWLVGPAPSATPTQLTALVVDKFIDGATPPLFDAACTGRIIPNGRLLLRRPGAKPLEFLTVHMSNVKVIRLTSSWDGETPFESVQLQFAGATMVFVEQKADGTAGQSFTASC